VEAKKKNSLRGGEKGKLLKKKEKKGVVEKPKREENRKLRENRKAKK